MVSISFYVKNINCLVISYYVLVIYWQRNSNENQIMIFSQTVSKHQPQTVFKHQPQTVSKHQPQKNKKEVETPIFINNNGFYYLSRSISQSHKTLTAEVLE